MTIQISKPLRTQRDTTKRNNVPCVGFVAGLMCGTSLLVSVPMTIGTAAAQTQSADEFLETILVTSRKREEALIDVPLSVRAFTDVELNARQVQSLVDFDTLEFVLVLTSFQPIDITIFDEPEENQ